MPDTKLKWTNLKAIHLKCLFDSVSMTSYKGEDSGFISELMDVIRSKHEELTKKEEVKDGS